MPLTMIALFLSAAIFAALSPFSDAQAQAGGFFEKRGQSRFGHQGSTTVNKVRFITVDFACLGAEKLARIKDAQKKADEKTIAALLSNGCFMTSPQMKDLIPLETFGLAIKVQGTPEDFGFQNTPGMENVRNLVVWTMRENVR